MEPSEVFCQECLQPKGFHCVNGFEVNEFGELLEIIIPYHQERVFAAQYTFEMSAMSCNDQRPCESFDLA
jgi:hypothetical protein